MRRALFVNFTGASYSLFVHDCPEKEKITDLIECGAGRVENCPAGEYTIVLAAPEFPAGRKEIFSIEFITACCSTCKKLDIRDFRLNETSEYTADFNPMDVLERNLTWSEAEKYRRISLLASQSSLLADDSSGNSNDDAFMETSLQLRGQVRKYSLAHEKDILEFVMRQGAYDMVKGNSLWKMMEEKQMCGGRTWQSMREHFLKKILPAIESFNLSETQIAMFKNVRIVSSVANSDQPSCSHTELPDAQEDQCFIRKTKYYTEAEDKNLLKFIVQHKRYTAARGVRLWKLMERKKVLPGRSWQSMKERYQKILIWKVEEYLPSDVATQMLEADLGGPKQRTKKRKALAASHSLSPQTQTQMTEPPTGVRQTYSPYPTTSLSGSTNTSKSSVDRKAFVVKGAQNKKDSKQNLIRGSKRKLFSQRKSVMEFTQASESGKTTQSSEYQSAAVAQFHDSTLNSKSDDGGCSRSMRYAAVTCVHKKPQHNKNITTHCTGKSGGAVHNTDHTCQENVARKSDGLFRKLGMSKESGVLEKGGNLLEFRGASEESALDNASNECNLYVVSRKETDSEINMHPCHFNSLQQIAEEEEEEVGRNDVRNVPTEEQAVLSKERKTKVLSCQREQQAEFINDHILENMPHKEIAVQSKSSRHLLQDENASDVREATHEDYQENSKILMHMPPLRDANDRGEVQGLEDIHDAVIIYDSTKNTSDNLLHDTYKMYKQNAGQWSFEKYTKEIVNAGARQLGLTDIIALGLSGKEQESNSGHAAEHASEQNVIMRLSPANSRTATNTYMDTLLTQQHPTVTNSEGPEYPVEGIICSTTENGHVTYTECSDREFPGSSSLESGYPDEFSGRAQVSFSSSSVSSYTTVNCSDMVPENITANASPEQSTHCCSSQASMSPSSSLPPEESSHSYKKGYPDEFSGRAQVSFSSSSVSSCTTVNCSDMVPENITANASPEQSTHCC